MYIEGSGPYMLSMNQFRTGYPKIMNFTGTGEATLKVYPINKGGRLFWILLPSHYRPITSQEFVVYWEIPDVIAYGAIGIGNPGLLSSRITNVISGNSYRIEIMYFSEMNNRYRYSAIFVSQ